MNTSIIILTALWFVFYFLMAIWGGILIERRRHNIYHAKDSLTKYPMTKFYAFTTIFLIIILFLLGFWLDNQWEEPYDLSNYTRAETWQPEREMNNGEFICIIGESDTGFKVVRDKDDDPTSIVQTQMDFPFYLGKYDVFIGMYDNIENLIYELDRKDNTGESTLLQYLEEKGMLREFLCDRDYLFRLN